MEKQIDVRKAYDLWSSGYDFNVNKTRDLDANATQETLSKYSFKSVLELGCGTGKNTSWLLTKASSIIGLDFSQGMLVEAKKKIDNERVTFFETDLNAQWPVENGAMDLVTSSLTLEHIQDLNHIFEQAQLKLVTDGTFFICELHPFKQYMGSGANFKMEKRKVHPKVYMHHISDYIKAAYRFGFLLIELQEWFDETEHENPPRLISIVFKKVRDN